MKLLNTSIKYNFIIGALIGTWCFLFAFFSKPFAHGTMDIEKWIYVSAGYSIIAFICYLIISYYQKYLYEKLARWNTYLEISVYVLFYSLFIVITYAYYKSSIIGGFYSLSKYFLEIIINVILILSPLLFFVRRHVLKLIPVKQDDIIITGDNKLDLLKIKQSELVCVSNSQNYVEIYYLDNTELKSKLIRSSLKRIQSSFEFLIQVHRSHLINPEHFKSWKDSSIISLTQMELPVSKSYKKRLLSL
ncbi:MAG: LytTR family DNA-binding domain-containing protein [Maribacter litoralis]|uniref:LytTR family DNA-binding domain-containing protein n=1 Tax=Maribacter litoralis TaxID=2059726 RepID=UPI003296D79D